MEDFFTLDEGMLDDIRFFMKAMETLKANDMLDEHNKRVDLEKGFTPDQPIVISETKEYVHLEYSLLNVLFWNLPYRRSSQKLISTVSGRMIDQITVTVQETPLNEKEYVVYFDVTEGMMELSRTLQFLLNGKSPLPT